MFYLTGGLTLRQKRTVGHVVKRSTASQSLTSSLDQPRSERKWGEITAFPSRLQKQWYWSHGKKIATE
ncbi:MAG: hypothetical protein OXC63_14185, partial [Aestuariivita sp.]|nr:hypothetical protein [Aestuariivita sp.]